MDNCSGKWQVNIKGSAGSNGFEISVVRADNDHGILSYGWFNHNKLLITHNGGPCHWPLTQKVWDKCVAIAHETANELNAEEGR